MNKIINCIINFSQYNWSFEFILNNKWNLNKTLFYFKYNNPKVIFDYINNIFTLNNNIKDIFELYWKNINHIWYDQENNRYKFYIWLYNNTFKDSLKIIKNCKDILNIKEKYSLEKDFYKFDSIWFDITEKWVNIKLYELVKKDQNYNLLVDNIKKEDIKEIWYLKDFYWRRKKFFRFKNYQDIEKFNNYFNIGGINNFEEKVKNYYLLQKKVKYFCVEWDKKEIYFV